MSETKRRKSSTILSSPSDYDSDTMERKKDYINKLQNDDNLQSKPSKKKLFKTVLPIKFRPSIAQRALQDNVCHSTPMHNNRLQFSNGVNLCSPIIKDYDQDECKKKSCMTLRSSKSKLLDNGNKNATNSNNSQNNISKTKNKGTENCAPVEKVHEDNDSLKNNNKSAVITDNKVKSMIIENNLSENDEQNENVNLFGNLRNNSVANKTRRNKTTEHNEIINTKKKECSINLSNYQLITSPNSGELAYTGNANISKNNAQSACKRALNGTPKPQKPSKIPVLTKSAEKVNPNTSKVKLQKTQNSDIIEELIEKEQLKNTSCLDSYNTKKRRLDKLIIDVLSTKKESLTTKKESLSTKKQNYTIPTPPENDSSSKATSSCFSNISKFCNSIHDTNCGSVNIFDSVKAGSIVDRFISGYDHNILEKGVVPWRCENNDYLEVPKIPNFSINLSRKLFSRIRSLKNNEKTKSDESSLESSVMRLKSRKDKPKKSYINPKKNHICLYEDSDSSSSKERYIGKQKDIKVISARKRVHSPKEKWKKIYKKNHTKSPEIALCKDSSSSSLEERNIDQQKNKIVITPRKRHHSPKENHNMSKKNRTKSPEISVYEDCTLKQRNIDKQKNKTVTSPRKYDHIPKKKLNTFSKKNRTNSPQIGPDEDSTLKEKKVASPRKSNEISMKNSTRTPGVDLVRSLEYLSHSSVSEFSEDHQDDLNLPENVINCENQISKVEKWLSNVNPNLNNSVLLNEEPTCEKPNKTSKPIVVSNILIREGKNHREKEQNRFKINKTQNSPKINNNIVQQNAPLENEKFDSNRTLCPDKEISLLQANADKDKLEEIHESNQIKKRKSRKEKLGQTSIVEVRRPQRERRATRLGMFVPVLATKSFHKQKFDKFTTIQEEEDPLSNRNKSTKRRNTKSKGNVKDLEVSEPLQKGDNQSQTNVEVISKGKRGRPRKNKTFNEDSAEQPRNVNNTKSDDVVSKSSRKKGTSSIQKRTVRRSGSRLKKASTHLQYSCNFSEANMNNRNTNGKINDESDSANFSTTNNGISTIVKFGEELGNQILDTAKTSSEQDSGKSSMDEHTAVVKTRKKTTRRGKKGKTRKNLKKGVDDDIVILTPTVNKFIETPCFSSHEDENGLQISNSLISSPGSCILCIRLSPGSSKSTHLTKKYTLYFTVIRGIGKFKLMNEIIPLSATTLVFVPTGSTYSIHNTSKTEELLLSCTRIRK